MTDGTSTIGTADVPSLAPPVRWWRWDLARGALAGVIAGTVVALYNSIAAAAGGSWLPVKAAAYPFLGGAALEPGFQAAAVALGLALHVAIATAWGALFGLAVEPFERKFYPYLGALWGMVVWTAMFQIGVQLAGAGPLSKVLVPADVIGAHVLFGIALGLVYRQLDVRGPADRGRTADVGAMFGPPR